MNNLVNSLPIPFRKSNSQNSVENNQPQQTQMSDFVFQNYFLPAEQHAAQANSDQASKKGAWNSVKAYLYKTKN